MPVFSSRKFSSSVSISQIFPPCSSTLFFIPSNAAACAISDHTAEVLLFWNRRQRISTGFFVQRKQSDIAFFKFRIFSSSDPYIQFSLKIHKNLQIVRHQPVFWLECAIKKHCFICRPSDSTVPTDAGIAPRTLATGALAFRRSNH